MMMLVVCLSAQPISEQEALQKAQRFLKGKSMVSLDKAANTRGSVNVKPFKHLYLFNAEDNGGFVIVAGDSRAREILGYADEGHLDYSQMPENMKWWLNFYDESIASIPADVTVAETRAADDSKPAVKPMMSYSWNQMSPYNYYCPQGCLSGCIPTAMAQMLVFHGYPTNLPALPAYTDDNGNHLDALQANYMDYQNMSYYDPAILVRYCGQAVKVSYGKQATGGSSGAIPPALVNLFGLDKGTHNVYRASYSAKGWDDLLYNELSSGRPFILSGQVNNDPNNGHAFICHGYSQGYYAVNWGWGGTENGYFAMSAMTTSSGDFSTDQIACIGIRPPAGGSADYPAFSLLKMEAVNSQATRASSSSSFSNIQFSWRIKNSLLETTSYQIGVAIFRPDGNTDLLWKYDAISYDPTYNTTAVTTVNIGSQYGDGTYKITLIYKKTDDTTWQVCQGFYWRYVEAVISGNTITFTNYPTWDPPFETGDYPTDYPTVDPDDPDPDDPDPDDPDDPDPDDPDPDDPDPDDPDPDNPDNPDITEPTTNIAFDYPVVDVDYESESVYFEIDWNKLSTPIFSKLDMTQTQFFDYYSVDCFADEQFLEVPAEDARYVTPYAYNYNNYDSYGVNIYDMAIYNFGYDFYGNGGTPPESADDEADPEYNYVAIAAFYPNYRGKDKHALSFQILTESMEKIVQEETSPVTFTRWLCFAAKSDDEGNITAPYRFIWVKLPITISWETEDPDGINALEADVSDNYYYDLRGQRIDGPLKKGIYIHKGKKIVGK